MDVEEAKKLHKGLEVKGFEDFVNNNLYLDHVIVAAVTEPT